jgi:hypothetical protein
LEPVKAAGFGYLYLGGEPLSKVFEYYAIRGSKESEDMLDEVPFILGESVPILDVLG